MGVLTQFFNLFKPAKTDSQAVAKLNENMDIIDTEMHKPPLSVNGVFPDSTTRDLTLNEVPLAGNLSSDDAQSTFGTYIERSTGGDASIADGSGWLVAIKGKSVKTGYVPESLNMTVTPATREEGETAITATLDRDTFVAAVQSSGTITLTYTTAWSADPATYGVTVEGTPVNGDVITIVYVKENRGTITNATPVAYNSTGWNLYNHSNGYAKVVKYSENYGFCISGAWSLVEFATTPTGSRTTITPVEGYFTVPSDGYVIVTGGNSTTTEIYMTWSDWILPEDHPSFAAYSVDSVSVADVMVDFAAGLCSVGVVKDEINLNTQTAISRIQRLAYTAQNLAAVIASGVDYDTDENYIYAVREEPVVYDIEIDGEYSVNDHGIEFITGTSVPCEVETLYGNDLKGKLRRDVLTISAQQLSSSQQAQVQSNIGLVPTQATNITAAGYVADARAVKTLNDHMDTFFEPITLYNSNGVVFTSGSGFQAINDLSQSSSNYKFMLIEFDYSGFHDIVTIFTNKSDSRTFHVMFGGNNPNDGVVRTFALDFQMSGRYFGYPLAKFSSNNGSYSEYTGNGIVITRMWGVR